MDALDIGHAALAVVDMQNDFVDLEVGSYAIGAERMVARIARVIAAARKAKVPVIFSQEVHRASGVDGGRLLWDGRSGWVTGKHPRAKPGEAPSAPCIEGTKGFEIVDELAPEADDIRILKRRFSIFVGTELDMVLRRLGIDTLLIVGVCADVCVLWTTGDAYQRDYRVHVLEDCVAGTSADGQAAALKIIRALTNSGRPMTSDAAIAALERHALTLTGARQLSA
jgi:nicotinamidase-related amidase